MSIAINNKVTQPEQQNLDSNQINTLTTENLQKGIIIFNTTINKFQGWDGTKWVNLNE